LEFKKKCKGKNEGESKKVIKKIWLPTWQTKKAIDTVMEQAKTMCSSEGEFI